MNEASRRAAEMSQLDMVKDFVARHGGDANTVIAISCLLDTAIARAVEGERERIIAFMGDGLSEWHRAALRAPGVKTNEKEVVERIVTGGQPG